MEDDPNRKAFQEKLFSQLKEHGVLKDIKIKIRQHLIDYLKGTDSAKEPLSDRSKNLSPKYRAINLLVADYLLQQGYQYALSVFSLEDPTLAIITERTKITKVEEGQRKSLTTFKFIDSDILDILETLGFTRDSDIVHDIHLHYADSHSSDPFLICLIKCLSKYFLNNNHKKIEINNTKSCQCSHSNNNIQSQIKLITSETCNSCNRIKYDIKWQRGFDTDSDDNSTRTYSQMKIAFDDEIRLVKDEIKKKYDRSVRMMDTQIKIIQKDLECKIIYMKDKCKEKLKTQKQLFVMKERRFENEKQDLLQQLRHAKQSSSETSSSRTKHTQTIKIDRTNLACQTESENSSKRNSTNHQNEGHLPSKLSCGSQTTEHYERQKEIVSSPVKYPSEPKEPSLDDKSTPKNNRIDTSTVKTDLIDVNTTNKKKDTNSPKLDARADENINKGFSNSNGEKEAQIKTFNNDSNKSKHLDVTHSKIRDNDILNIDEHPSKAINEMKEILHELEKEDEKFIESFKEFKRRQVEDIKKDIEIKSVIGAHSITEDGSLSISKPMSYSRNVPRYWPSILNTGIFTNFKDDTMSRYDYLNQIYVDNVKLDSDNRAFGSSMNIDKNGIQNYVHISQKHAKDSSERPKSSADVIAHNIKAPSIPNIPSNFRDHFATDDAELYSELKTSNANRLWRTRSCPEDSFVYSSSGGNISSKSEVGYRIKRPTLKRWSLPAEMYKKSPLSKKSRNPDALKRTPLKMKQATQKGKDHQKIEKVDTYQSFEGDIEATSSRRETKISTNAPADFTKEMFANVAHSTPKKWDTNTIKTPKNHNRNPLRPKSLFRHRDEDLPSESKNLNRDPTEQRLTSPNKEIRSIDGDFPKDSHLDLVESIGNISIYKSTENNLLKIDLPTGRDENFDLIYDNDTVTVVSRGPKDDEQRTDRTMHKTESLTDDTKTEKNTDDDQGKTSSESPVKINDDLSESIEVSSHIRISVMKTSDESEEFWKIA